MRLLAPVATLLLACAPSVIAPRSTTARATVEALLDRPAGQPGIDLAVLARSRAVLVGAGASLGLPLDADAVRAQTVDARTTVEVSGEGPQAAVARCTAVVRAIEQSLRGHASSEPLAWLRAERRRLRQELAAVEAALPSVPTSDLPTLARLELQSAGDALAAGDARYLPWRLRALGSALVRSDEALAKASATHLDAHPQVVELRALRDAQRAAAEEQRRLEREWITLLVDELDRAVAASRPAPVLWARASAIQRALLAADCHVASAVPSAWEAEECLRARLEREKLALRLGERHPQMVVAQVRVEEAARRWSDARGAALAHVQELLAEAQRRPAIAPALLATISGDGARRRAHELEMLLRHLSDKIEVETDHLATPRPVLRVIAPCHP